MYRLQNLFLLIFALPLFLSCQGAVTSEQPINLRCEYLTNPLGIDVPAPRFTWQMATGRQGASQMAYQLFVGTDPAEVASGKGKVWESGKVTSSTFPVIYGGKSLVPRTRYYWCVKIEDEKGNWSGLSETAFFETGMVHAGNWRGHWITDSYDTGLKPAPYYRKKFSVEKKVQSARAYIAVAGLYELSLNGSRVGDHRLDPMYTRFDRRNLYVTYDVTSLLKEGENVTGVLLGNGWYNHQSTAVWFFDKAPWRARPKFCMELHIRYDDGTTDLIVSDQNWKTSLSPVIFNSIYTAEHYDARLEQPGWDAPGFDDSKWKSPFKTGAPSSLVTSQSLHPIRNVEEIAAKSVKQLGPRTWLFDFGRNIAGVTRIRVSGNSGCEIRLKHAERLDEKGYADLSNIDVHYRPVGDSDPFQTDIFILSGKGGESFMPRFNYKGFQYVEVTSTQPLDLSEKSLVAYFMHSDVPPVGSIRSSNSTLDKMWQAANASYLSNLFGYPTDCPQREKNGWTGDAQINIETGLYNFDGITVYEKWLADHRDEQQPNGVLPAIIPTNGWGYHWANGPDWTSTIALIPWNIYLFYGDSRLLSDCYDNIRRYVESVERTSTDGLTSWGLGDWVPVKSVTPKEFTSSIYYYVDASILARAAKLFEKREDAEKYGALALKIKEAINRKYLNPETGMYGSGLQTELSAALMWGIVPDSLTGKVAKNLADRVIADDSHIDVGLLGSKTILNALSENGYAGLAATVALQETFPSWGWWIVNGATTFYENWPIDAARDISMNHIMFGEVSAWFYKALGGIFPDEAQPGFKNVILRPHFVEQLDHFGASYTSVYGTLTSSWKREEGKIRYEVVIPANTTATIFLEGKKVMLDNKDVLRSDFLKAKQEGKGFVVKAPAGTYLFVVEG